jgi:hypothetical protein
MTARSNLHLPAKWIGFFALSVCGLIVCTSFALDGESPSAQDMSRGPFHIEVQDGQGVRIAGPEVTATSSKPPSAVLAFDREYQPGDRIIFSGPQRMAVKLDETMTECMLYLPASSQANISYEIPYGHEEQNTGIAFSPESFAGKSHKVALRALDKKELTGYRNLALNPCDFRVTEQTPPPIFPHATSNSVSRNAFDFEARNAIDGVTQNGHHGAWPYQSWGPQLRLDLWWKLDFGRPVELDKIRLMVRTDYPHDGYWKSGDVEFSDGSHLPIQISSSADFQDFTFPKRGVTWLRLTSLVPSAPDKWCSFIEFEAWGRDLP